MSDDREDRLTRQDALDDWREGQDRWRDAEDERAMIARTADAEDLRIIARHLRANRDRAAPGMAAGLERIADRMGKPGPATADVMRIFSRVLGYVDRMATERPGYRMHLDDFELSVKITTGQARAFLAEHEAATTGNVMPIEDPGDPAFYS